ncbi:MAG: hypothetical protein JST90_00710 [Bacteroidetes bacterium]|nr:hypothetical protein [Bacteroidota bacterium]
MIYAGKAHLFYKKFMYVEDSKPLSIQQFNYLQSKPDMYNTVVPDRSINFKSFLKELLVFLFVLVALFVSFGLVELLMILLPPIAQAMAVGIIVWFICGILTIIGLLMTIVNYWDYKHSVRLSRSYHRKEIQDAKSYDDYLTRWKKRQQASMIHWAKSL